MSKGFMIFQGSSAMYHDTFTKPLEEQTFQLNPVPSIDTPTIYNDGGES